MAASDVKVLGAWPSPFVNRVVIALTLKSIKFELVETNPYKKSELLLETNPIHKKVPVLIHAGRPICESLIIVQYIDDAWPNGPTILPSDPYDRSLARFWAAYIDEKWSPLVRHLREVQGEAAKAVLEKISEGMLLLEEAFISCSKGKDFFGGDNVGYLDIALGCHVGWIRMTETLVGAEILDDAKTPHLVGWAERLYSDSCVKDVMLEPQTLLEIFRKFQAMSTSASE